MVLLQGAHLHHLRPGRLRHELLPGRRHAQVHRGLQRVPAGERVVHCPRLRRLSAARVQTLHHAGRLFQEVLLMKTRLLPHENKQKLF